MHRAGTRAVVVGGGVAGLLAGRVLSDHFDEVRILERDRYPDSSDMRSGVPQSRHVHLLLLRGKQILERLFPALTRELVRSGAVTVRMGDELAVLTYHGWRVRHAGGPSLLTCTRPLLEKAIRRRLLNRENIELAEGFRATGLVTDNEGKKLAGVSVRPPDQPKGERTIYGDLVVDASGRFSDTPDWLRDNGYDPPEETVVDPFLGYASRIYEQPNAAGRRAWKALLLLGKPPDRTRGGVVLPVEGNRWHVTLAGVGGDYPPHNEDEFLDFARTLRSDQLFEAIRDARPLSPVAGYRATNNRRRRYEKLDRWPSGLVVLGDALCALNPIYAQGMSVAAQQVLFLDRCLSDHPPADNDGIREAAEKFRREVVDVIRTPWRMATTDDLRWPDTEGGEAGLSARLMHRYHDAVIALATKYPGIDDLYARVAHLTEPAYKLLHPRIALRAMAELLKPLRRQG